MGRIWTWREAEADAFWAEACQVLEGEGIVALPTETFYALAAHPFKEAALRRLFALKERPRGKPVLLLVATPEMLTQVVEAVPPAAVRLMARFWPGPLTIIFPARPHLPGMLTGDTRTIGVRQPRQGLTCRLIAALGFPVTGTSANRAGLPPLTRASQVARELGAGVDLILDAGPCPGGLASTIVDVTGTPVRLVRSGAIPAELLAEVIPEILDQSEMRAPWRKIQR